MSENSSVRKLTKSSAFRAEVLNQAPADLAVTHLSNKYRDLRNDLSVALNTHAWGLQLNVMAETPEELRHQVRNLTMAGNSWSRSIQLPKRGRTLKTHYNIANDGLTATMYLYFEDIKEYDPREDDE